MCCEPLHDGRARAATAEQLMRSRYAAYALGRSDYVFRTWHPRTRPADVLPVPGLVWTGLSVLAVEAGREDDDEGVVTFEAQHDGPDGPGCCTSAAGSSGAVGAGCTWTPPSPGSGNVCAADHR